MQPNGGHDSIIVAESKGEAADNEDCHLSGEMKRLVWVLLVFMFMRSL